MEPYSQNNPGRHKVQVVTMLNMLLTYLLMPDTKTILQSHSNKNSMVLAQKQTYRPTEQNHNQPFNV